MSEREHPQQGDLIVHKRNDGRYDIMRFARGQGNVELRTEIPTLDMARDIARSNLSSGGMLWYTHWEDVERIEPLR